MHLLDIREAHPLFGTEASRMFEREALASAKPFALMRRAGKSVARLALAIAPHAQSIWVACGPGNNGGDGIEAALELAARGKTVIVTWLGDPLEHTSPDTPYQRAVAAGVFFSEAQPSTFDLCIDGLLGIGSNRPPSGLMAHWINSMNAAPAICLAIDLPTGLDADTGVAHFACVQADATLALMTLKPGLFTGKGRDASGSVWFEALGRENDQVAQYGPPSATLIGHPTVSRRLQDSHKGSYGDVAIVGGAAGMRGAALLAGIAALHFGAGRVFVAQLDQRDALVYDCAHPEIMFRHFADFDLASKTLVCGCGGGDAVRAVIPKVLTSLSPVVLDADALNAIAIDSQLETLLRARQKSGKTTVMTPHPLEASRLLATSTERVQKNRLTACLEIADRFQCTVVLKGSGTVICTPQQVPAINPTGNPRLACAGTGDVLAGMIGARLAAKLPAHTAACEGAYMHGCFADHWQAETALTASALASAIRLELAY